MAVKSKRIKSGIEVAALTDVGLQRSNNEDSFVYWEPEQAEEISRKGRLAVIADGMGGYEGGLEASRLAVETVRHVYENNVADNPQQLLLAGVISAHEAIQRYALDHIELQGMGTTCTALAIVENRLYFAHVGDSRLYLIRPQAVVRLTRDHSYVGRLVESGIVRSEDAESHPQRHILTAALGSGREVFPDSPEQPIPLEAGDRLLLCTDGLWSVVAEQELASVMRSESPEKCCRELLNLALERGGPDNVTVLVLHVSV
jgi:serine/threonine protein phosphatase PrpC